MQHCYVHVWEGQLLTVVVCVQEETFGKGKILT